MIMILQNKKELDQVSTKELERANLVLLYYEEMNEFAVLKTRSQLGAKDYQKCLLAVNILNDLTNKNEMTNADLARELLRL